MKMGLSSYGKKQSALFRVKLKPSKTLLGLSIGFHLIAFAACFLNALPYSIKFTVAIFILLSLTNSFHRLKSESRKISYSEKSGWEIGGDDGFEPVEVQGSTVVTFFAIFLHFKNKPPLLIANDALDDKDFRQLTVMLKMTCR